VVNIPSDITPQFIDGQDIAFFEAPDIDTSKSLCKQNGRIYIGDDSLLISRIDPTFLSDFTSLMSADFGKVLEGPVVNLSDFYTRITRSPLSNADIRATTIFVCAYFARVNNIPVSGLNMDNNRLQFFDVWVKGFFPNLKWISLAGNPIKDPPDSIPALRGIEVRMSDSETINPWEKPKFVEARAAPAVEKDWRVVEISPSVASGPKKEKKKEVVRVEPLPTVFQRDSKMVLPERVDEVIASDPVQDADSAAIHGFVLKVCQTVPGFDLTAYTPWSIFSVTAGKQISDMCPGLVRNCLLPANEAHKWIGASRIAEAYSQIFEGIYGCICLPAVLVAEQTYSVVVYGEIQLGIGERLPRFPFIRTCTVQVHDLGQGPGPFIVSDEVYICDL
jgi:hypothetical protein